MNDAVEHLDHLAHRGAVERETKVLLEHVGLASPCMPPAQGNRIERALGDAAEAAHERADGARRQRQVGGPKTRGQMRRIFSTSRTFCKCVVSVVATARFNW